MFGKDVRSRGLGECSTKELFPQLARYGEKADCGQLVEGTFRGIRFRFIESVKVRRAKKSLFSGTIFWGSSMQILDLTSEQEICGNTGRPFSRPERKIWLSNRRICGTKVWSRERKLSAEEREKVASGLKWLEEYFCNALSYQYLFTMGPGGFCVVFREPETVIFEYVMDILREGLVHLDR